MVIYKQFGDKLKTCTVCLAQKEFSSFSKRSAMRDGYRSACKACELNRNKEYYSRPESKEKLKIWCAGAGKDKRKDWNASWESRNTHVRYEMNARYRTVIAQQTPIWSDKKSILALYKIAAVLRKNGRDVEVDHIVPLQSPFVCGLHVKHNLQVIPKLENSGKRNRYWPNMASQGEI